MFITRLTGLLVLLAIIFAMHWAASAAQCPAPRSKVTQFGLNRTINKQLTTDIREVTVPFSIVGEVVRYGRVRIAPSNLQAGWKIIVRDQNLRPLQVIDYRDFANGVERIWTKRLPTTMARLTLVVENSMPDLVIKLTMATSMPKEAKNPYYSTKGSVADWRDIFASSLSEVPAKVRKLGDSVGMFTTFTGSVFQGVDTWCCSGSIIAKHPDLLFLTNFHCGGPKHWPDEMFWQNDICPNAIVDMSWDGDDISMEYACKRVVKFDRELDAAIIELSPIVRSGSLAEPLIIDGRHTAAGRAIRLIHHPRCLSKRTSTCIVGKSLGNWKDATKITDIAHQCDTAGGSSGSPVLDTQGNLVALHHIGYEKDADGQCDNRNKATTSEKLLKLLEVVPGVTIITD